LTEVDVQDVIDFLTDLVGPVSDVEVIGAGAWSTAFGFSTAGGRQVGRFGQYRGDFEKDRIAGSWASEGLPIPRVSDVGEAFGGYYAISEHCPGVPLESLDASGWESALPSLVTALDRLRSAVPKDVDGFGGWGPDDMPFPSWRAFMLAVVTDEPERRTHGWTDKLRKTERPTHRLNGGTRNLRP
jgi:hygromycin-B 4-O-kinase